MIKMRNLDSGFTLVEVLVVIIILGVITGISIVAFGSSRQNSLASACKTSYQSALLGIQAYQSDHDGQVPDSLAALVPTYVNAGLLNSENFALLLEDQSADLQIYVVKPVASPRLIATSATLTSNGNTAVLDSTDGVAVGMTVTGSAIPVGTTVSAAPSGNAISLSAPANFTLSAGGNTLATATSYSKYSLIFGGNLLSGTAPNACLKL